MPASAVSGVYFAKLTRTDPSEGASHITFIVRNDASTSDLFFQTSDTTWQAYNTYGGSDFYEGGAHGRAYKLSYNRPFATRGNNAGRDFLFSNEYPMIRFLERNGYDVSYTTGVDTRPAGQPASRTTRSSCPSGHDEYWSGTQRANVEAARDAGVNLAFFSGNEVYWKTRWESSQDGANTAYRTLVCYKETWANAEARHRLQRVDRHVARSPVQPAVQRWPAGERADSARRTWPTSTTCRSRSPATRASSGSGATPV